MSSSTSAMPKSSSPLWWQFLHGTSLVWLESQGNWQLWPVSFTCRFPSVVPNPLALRAIKPYCFTTQVVSHLFANLVVNLQPPLLKSGGQPCFDNHSGSSGEKTRTWNTSISNCTPQPPGSTDVSLRGDIHSWRGSGEIAGKLKSLE